MLYTNDKQIGIQKSYYKVSKNFTSNSFRHFKGLFLPEIVSNCLFEIACLSEFDEISIKLSIFLIDLYASLKTFSFNELAISFLEWISAIYEC